MRSHRDNEAKVAEALSLYIDALGAGPAPDVDQFLDGHPDVAERLRPLLFAAAATQHAMSAELLPARSPRTTGAPVADLSKARTRRGVERGTAQMQLDQRPDVLLLLLRAVGKVWGKTRLQKLLFLVAKETDVSRFVLDFNQHYACNFGPFDHLVDHDVTQLCSAGVIRIAPPRAPTKAVHRVDAVFELTDRGVKFADALARSAEGSRVLMQLRELGEKYARMPLNQLVKYVYSTYPEYTGKSKIRSKVLGKDGNDE